MVPTAVDDFFGRRGQESAPQVANDMKEGRPYVPGTLGVPLPNPEGVNRAAHHQETAHMESFYETLYDYYVAILQRPGSAPFREVPAPQQFWPMARCAVTVRGTRQHWTLHVVRHDTQEACDLSPVVAHWWAWRYGGLDTAVRRSTTSARRPSQS